MTVRAWFTISAVALAVLAVAFVVRFTRPVQAPALLASAATTRLEGEYRGSCWPQPGGDLRCVPDPRPRLEDGPSIGRSGTIRVFADFPVQPEGGTLRIEPRRGGDPVARAPWDDRLPYALDPGAYVLRAEARYPEGGRVRYDFPFRVR